MWIHPLRHHDSGRPLRSIALLGSILFASSLLAPPALAQGLFIDSFTPTSGNEGTLVTLQGGGFAADPADHWAFVRDEFSGNGALLTAVSGNATSWTGELGPAATPFAGSLLVWSGHLWQFPSKVYALEAGVFLVERIRFFVPKEAVEVAGTFTVTSPSPYALDAVIEEDAISFEMPPSGPSTIDLHVTIDGGSAEHIPPGGFAESPRPKRGSFKTHALPGARAFHLRIHNIEPKSARPELLAQAVKRILTETYGALGLWVEVQGTRVSVHLEGAAGYRGSFGVLSWEP